jgi:putative transposase
MRNQSSFSCESAGVSAENLRRMGLIDRQYTARPFYGSRRRVIWLEQQGEVVNRNRVRRLMRIRGLEAIDSRPRLSQAGQGHRISPDLLRGVKIERRDQV